MTRSICLFTIEFPGGSGETFIEREVEVLSSYFEKIYLLPSRSTTQLQRKMPPNVEIIQLFESSDNHLSVKWMLRYWRLIFRIYSSSMVSSSNSFNYFRYCKSLTEYLWLDVRKVRVIKDFILSNQLQDSIFYDYWTINSSISLATLKDNGIISKFICRAHGFDLYHDRHIERVIPFREYIYQYVDRVFVISHHGLNYLVDRMGSQMAKKIEVGYLGISSLDLRLPPSKKTSDKYRLIVSCSNLVPVKRVERIAEVLGNTPQSMQIRWVHFGDGPERQKVMDKIKLLSPNIDVELVGQTENEEILSYYHTHYVDLFINLSESEGLPVSMMEAQSFGIPILAPSVNGIPEIVNEKTGRLIRVEDDVKTIAAEIENALAIDFDRDLIVEHFEQKFDAKVNYDKFALRLMSL